MSNVDFAAVDFVVDSSDDYDAFDIAPLDADAVPVGVGFVVHSVDSTPMRSRFGALPLLPTLSPAPKDWNS